MTTKIKAVTRSSTGPIVHQNGKVLKSAFLLINILCTLAIACNIPTLILYDVGPFDLCVFRAGLTPSQYQSLETLNHLTRYVIRFNISDDLQSVEGSQLLRYTNNEDTPLSEVVFHLYPNLLGGEMRINSVTVDGSSSSPEFDEAQSLMRLPLAAPMQPGRSIIIGIDFSVVVPTRSSSAYFGILIYSEQILSLAHAYPMVAAYDTDGWDTDTPWPIGDIIFSDASFYRVTVEAPIGLAVVASGIETDRQLVNGRQQITILDGPARDFYLAASPDFVKLSKQTDRLTINSYTLAGEEQAGQEVLDFAEAALQVFSNRYGSFPYIEFDVVPLPLSTLGIEFPGLIGIDLDLYLSSEINRADMLELISTHEVAHQWFYNLVGNDQLDEPWLDESLAQFAVIKYFADTDPAMMQAFEARLEGNLDWLGGMTIPIGLPVREYSSDTYLSIVYNEGPLVLQKLEEIMGQNVFDLFLHDYVQSLAWEVSSTQAFKSLAEQYCSCDLTPFFEEWIYP